MQHLRLDQRLLVISLDKDVAGKPRHCAVMEQNNFSAVV
jgi:hypothetical protein